MKEIISIPGRFDSQNIIPTAPLPRIQECEMIITFINRVVEAKKRLSKSDDAVKKRKLALLKVANLWDKAEVRNIKQAIEEECKKIDYSEW